MLFDFRNIKEVVLSNMNDGEGLVSAKMHMDSCGKIMLSSIPANSTISLHQHITSSEINHVISGEGIAMCDGAEEELTDGTCHYCPKGSSHSIINNGTENLVLFTVVPEHTKQ